MGLKFLQFLCIWELFGRNSSHLFFTSSFLLSVYDFPYLAHVLAQVLLVSPRMIFQHGEKKGPFSFSEVVLAVHLVSPLSCFRGNFLRSLVPFLMCWGSLLHPTHLLSSNKNKPISNLLKLPLAPLWKIPLCSHHCSHK